MEAGRKFEQGIVGHLIISQQGVRRLPQPLHCGIEAFLVDDCRDVIAERQSMTSFLPKTIHQEVRLSLVGFTWLILAEKEHVETDAGGTLILQSPLPLEQGVLVLGLRLLHIEG